MNVSDAIRGRRSIRDFLPDPVPESVLRQIFDAARWAPSGSNIQAWRVIAVTGTKRDAVIRMARSKHEAGLVRSEAFPIYPPNLWEPLRSRRFALAEDMYRALGIPREDKVARRTHVARNFEFFGAPIGLFFVIDRRVAHGQWAHLGMLIQTIALLIEERGLGCCMQEAWAAFRPELAGMFNLSADEMVYCGMAVGQPDRTKPVNQFERTRISVDELAEFLGFKD
ncbi:MAG: nitroreductase [Gammaproteobacteria bacterium]|nr:nitroreductase [Gammaproteobacteria bacterium]